MPFQSIIIGSGFAGSVTAEYLARHGHKVLIIDSRRHVGGNCFDSYNEFGILVQNYGPHIFHTDSEKVWQYLSQFTQWLPYQHRVLGFIDGQKVTIPFNLNSLRALFPKSMANHIEAVLVNEFGFGKRLNISELRQSGDKDIQELADYIYNKIFKDYSLKQWGIMPDEVESHVTARIPVNISHDDRYFLDKYQAIPQPSYATLFEKMLSHPNIKCMLNTDMKDVIRMDTDNKKFFAFDKKFNGNIIYTGCLDRLFDYKYGPLPYRSIEFTWQTLDQKMYQEVAVVNYPMNYDYTRITEYKHLTSQLSNRTSISIEYPKECRLDNGDIPYYPVFTPANNKLFNMYSDLANSFPRLYCLGRLAEFRYYDMDDIVEKALSFSEREII